MILNYVVTSNHVHLIVYGKDDNDTIPKPIQLQADRTGQEYKQRKYRNGAFWKDRYLSAAVETGEHLQHCLIYVDLYMVRAAVVTHPKDWLHVGYQEIWRPRRRYVLIDYEAIGHLSGYDNFTDFQAAHRAWVKSVLSGNGMKREACWTQSIAAGGRSFVEAVKNQVASWRLGVKPGAVIKISNFGSLCRPIIRFSGTKTGI